MLATGKHDYLDSLRGAPPQLFRLLFDRFPVCLWDSHTSDLFNVIASQFYFYSLRWHHGHWFGMT